MTTPKRMALAFGCMLLAIATLGILSAVLNAIRYGPRSTLPVLDMLPVYLLFAFPGWVIALPFIALLKDADGWRAWAVFTIGTTIGPGFMLTWTLFASNGRMSWQKDGFGLLLSLTIGFLTTSFYVLLLKLLKRKTLVA
jgi:hypothetical protein